MTRCLFFSVFSLFLAAPLTSKAQNAYVFGYGGVNLIENFDSSMPPGMGSFSFDLEPGYTIGGGVGMRTGWFGGSRFEIEGLYQSTKLDNVKVTAMMPNPVVAVTPVVDDDVEIESDTTTKAVMVNFLKEIPLGCFCGYVGGGVGIASFGLDTTLNDVNFFDSSTAFAGQFIAGVDVPLNDCLSLFTQYRVMWIDGTDLNSGGVAFTTDTVVSHGINLGARYRF